MKPLSLRGKIVVMASVVVAAACLFLTVISITSANKYMRSLVSYDTTSSVQGASAPHSSQGSSMEDWLQGEASPPVSDIE